MSGGALAWLALFFFLIPTTPFIVRSTELKEAPHVLVRVSVYILAPKPTPLDNRCCEIAAVTGPLGVLLIDNHLFYRFKKAVNRGGTTLLQKTGQVDRTEDSEFKEEEARFRLLVRFFVPFAA